MAKPKHSFKWLKPVAHLLLALPLIWLLWQWVAAILGMPHGLGVNAIETTIRFLGDTAIRVLLVALAVSPLSWAFGWKQLMQIRRLTGLWAFAYVIIHLMAYFGMDQLFNFGLLWEDVLKRKYITLGMIAVVMLIPLAITSTNKMVRRVGAKRWQYLHRSVYIIGILAVFHHWFMVKGIQLAPIVHGFILLILLSMRVMRWGLKQRRRNALTA